MSPDEVHVWRIDLAVDDEALASCAAQLAADERARAARFLVEPARRAFVVARARLRALLGRHLDRDPAALAFDANRWGKPALRGPDPLHFNVAHSGDVAVIAVARHPVGVDVEQVRDLHDLDALAASSFAPAEVARLRALPVTARRAAFFACWTRKEAFVKAHGRGLSMPLDTFAVSVAPGDDTVELAVAGDDAAAWTLRAFSAGDGYPAAIAIRQPGVALRTFAWGAPS